MSKSLVTAVTKEVIATAGYGFGPSRTVQLKAHIVDGNLEWVEIRRLPVEDTGRSCLKLEKDALELLQLFAPVTVEFLAEVEKEVGNVR